MSIVRPSEFELIARYFAPLAAPTAFGLLDDAAMVVVTPGHDLVVSKDMLVADRHFFRDDPAEAIAAKALRVNLSDLAAKGAKPLGFLLGLALPQDWKPEWLERFAAGLGKDAHHYHCPLLGGDTVRASGELMLSVTVLGEVPNGTMIRRTTAQAGDALYVTGTIGDAALGLQIRLHPTARWVKSLPELDRAFLLERYLLPRPRGELAEIIRLHASAAMDISDGFIGDLTKMLTAGSLELQIDAGLVPLSKAGRAALDLHVSNLATMLTGGDDYELLVAIPSANIIAFEAAVARTDTALTRLGVFAGSGSMGLVIHDESGHPLEFPQQSFSHF